MVLTHRDPLKTEPSSFSTLATVRWQRSDDVVLPEAGTGLGEVMIALARDHGLQQVCRVIFNSSEFLLIQ